MEQDYISLNKGYSEYKYDEYSQVIKYAYDPDSSDIIILNPYEITMDGLKLKFLDYLMSCLMVNTNDFEHQLNWKAHNILYRKKIFRKHNSTVRLRNKYSKFKMLWYKIVCFIFKER